MRLLKIFVAAMGVLIAGGAAVLVWGLAHQWNHTVAQSDGGTSAAPDTGYAAIDVPPPDGMSLTQMATTSDRLLLRFSGPKGERIVVVDPRTGRVTGTVTVAPTAQ